MNVSERSLTAGPYRFLENRYPAGLRSPEHAFPHDYFCFVIEGSYREWEESGMSLRTAGTAHFHRAGARQAGLVSEEGARCISIICDSRPAWCETGYPRGMLLSSERQRLLQEAFREGSDYFLASFADTLFRSIRQPVEVPPEWLQRVEREIRKDQGFSVEQLAGDAGVHPMHLWKAFRKWYGCTPGHHLREIRIERAQSLLQDRRLSLAEIALETGFADQSHLTRVFRKITGETPAAYRSRLVRF